MPKIDKLILSVKAPLTAKYTKNYPALLRLLQQWIRADKTKGLTTRLVFLDDRNSFTPFRARPVRPGLSKAKDYKEIIDKLYQHYDPDYVVLFGAVDILPQLPLLNPLYKLDHEDDRWVPSDLPYACNEGYSNNPSHFLSPVRVVGRVADVNGVADLALVKTTIENAIAAKPGSRQRYADYFAASVPMWRKSTDESVDAVFSGRVRVNLVPPKKDNWSAPQLRPLSHFVNCHGASGEPEWYGQRHGRNSYPVALSSAVLDGKVSRNTVIAAECCYGAQLYHPNERQLPDSLPICNTYFKNGAIAFLGSTTIAYGPSTSNNQADLLTQYFMMYVLAGASTGRALLEARQKYILNHGPDLSPTDLKTIAQFNLLGDPAVQPVTGRGQEFKETVGMTAEKPGVDPSRQERRKYLLSKGTALTAFVNFLKPGIEYSLPPALRTVVNRLLAENDMTTSSARTFPVRQNAVNQKTLRTKSLLSARYHVFLEPKKEGRFEQKLLSVKELDGRIVNIQLSTRK